MGELNVLQELDNGQVLVRLANIFEVLHTQNSFTNNALAIQPFNLGSQPLLDRLSSFLIPFMYVQ